MAQLFPQIADMHINAAIERRGATAQHIFRQLLARISTRWAPEAGALSPNDSISDGSWTDWKRSLRGMRDAETLFEDLRMATL